MSGMKLVNSKDRIEDRVEVNDNSRIDIPKEEYENLMAIRVDAEELDKARRELGRLSQVVNNLINVCNNIEDRMKSKRTELAKKMGVSEGRWAIDFEEKAFFSVIPSGPNV